MSRPRTWNRQGKDASRATPSRAGAYQRADLDLSSPEFQDAFFRLEADDLKQVVASLRRLRDLDWNSLYHCIPIMILVRALVLTELVPSLRRPSWCA